MHRLKVRDLMTTALITVRPRETVERADLDMKLAGIRHLPVLDERGRLVGVVSDRDLLRAFGLAGKKEVVIGEVMTAKAITVTEDTPAADAVEILIANKIGCLPVVSDDGHLVGLVTDTDFLELASRALRQGAVRG
jgi:CBS domain-containing protein